MINLTREEAQQVPLIEQLESVPEDARMIYEHSPFESENIPIGALCREAAKALRAKLSEPEPEPVDDKELMRRVIALLPEVAVKATEEPIGKKKEWQSLTEAEKTDIAIACGALSVDWLNLASAIEIKLKAKNGF